MSYNSPEFNPLRSSFFDGAGAFFAEKAALEQLEQERERRIAEKIEKGQAVRGPIVVVGVHPDSYPPLGRDSEGREIYPAEPISVIIAGVPRAAASLIEVQRGGVHRYKRRLLFRYVCQISAAASEASIVHDGLPRRL